MALADLAIRNLKPTGKPFKASDSGGLHLLVNPNGSRLWRLKYRYDGKEKLLALGAYPIVTLAKARGKRDEAKAQLADGIDPAKSRRESRIAAVATSGNTFRLVAKEYLDKLRREGRAPATLDPPPIWRAACATACIRRVCSFSPNMRRIRCSTPARRNGRRPR
ncbi:Arm DNA-binding domain-containing protein [Xanthobacter autotrophicus DSM 597]|uniref:Arm DNA-binding domain-containing protein n=1 Tax=Xanthobacter wiegelii TaxID=3119913 RepID=UPI00372B3C43